MPIKVYGDVTLDNYEYELGGEITKKTYKKLFRVPMRALPGVSSHMRNRFVARSFGGAYLIARHTAVALSLWRDDESRQAAVGTRGNPGVAPRPPDDRDTLAHSEERGLDKIRPWADVRKKLISMQDNLAKNPKRYEDFLNLFYRVGREDDGAYRVSKEGNEGFTLPNVQHEGQALFRCMIGNGAGKLGVSEKIDAPIVIGEDDGRDTTCIFNDAGTRLRLEEHQDWIEHEDWAQPGARERTWAIVKSLEPLKEEAVETRGGEGASTPNREAPLAIDAFLAKLHALLDKRVIIVLSADDLRRNRKPVSLSLSWEQSVRDVVACVETFAAKCSFLPANVVVTFDFDAALYMRLSMRKEGRNDSVKKVVQSVLIFSRNRSEGEFASEFSGSMPGSQSTFCSVLAALVHESLDADLSGSTDVLDQLVERILTYALIAKQRMLFAGFEPIDEAHMFARVVTRGANKRIRPRIMHHECAFALPMRPSTLVAPEAPPSALMPSHKKKAEHDPIVLMPHEFRHPVPIFRFDANSKKIESEQKKTFEDAQLRRLRKDQEEYGLASVHLDYKWLDDVDRELIDVSLEKLKPEGSANALPLNAYSAPFIDYVINGRIDYDGSNIPLPICTIGKIKTISATEIESLRAIRRMVDSYVASRERGRSPLGLTVFGQPGSGKSFTVKSIFQTLRGESKRLTENNLIECNLSGLRHPEDLASYFQRARDIRLEGGIPVLFFDEFDCQVETQPLFWLKYFLAPLQDGNFTSGHTTHPIGKSIFVFAGGTSRTFSEFQGKFFPKIGKDLENSKGRDFLSRLQGHIDIEGLHPTNGGPSEKTPAGGYYKDTKFRRFAMRRAILLREILSHRANTIFTGARADIDRNIVNAFLSEEIYHHGIRSIEAIIRMSSVPSGKTFSPECLPPRAQLEMHVSSAFYQRAVGAVE